jgi:DNA-binding Xre family transcriptional regulator
MENKPAAISAVAARNIKLELVDRSLTKNALATKAGIPSTTFTRKLDHPEQFTLKDLGSIAEALDVRFEDLLKDAA